MIEHGRRVGLTGAFNFRDLGGYASRDGRTVKWRKVFRSDTLDFLTQEDARVVQDYLRVDTVIDLRAPGELARRKVTPAFRPAAGRYELPIVDDATMEDWNSRPPSNPVTNVESYKWMVDNARTEITGALGVIARSGSSAAVFHCFAGKDRTGVLAAVLLSTLGIDDETVAHDYSITSEVIDQIIKRSIELARDPERVRSLPPAAFETKPEVMLEVLEHIRTQYGSVEEYISADSAGRDLPQKLRITLLE